MINFFGKGKSRKGDYCNRCHKDMHNKKPFFLKTKKGVFPLCRECYYEHLEEKERKTQEIKDKENIREQAKKQDKINEINKDLSKTEVVISNAISMAKLKPFEIHYTNDLASGFFNKFYYSVQRDIITQELDNQAKDYWFNPEITNIKSKYIYYLMDSLQLVNQILKRDFENLEALQIKGDIFVEMNNFQGAKDCYMQIMKICPLDIRNKNKLQICNNLIEQQKQEKQIFTPPSFDEIVDKGKTLKTASGLRIQSKGEKKIAEFLDKHKIGYDYDEQITLRGIEKNHNGYDTSWCRPDFYLTEFNIIIEYFGLKGTPRI